MSQLCMVNACIVTGDLITSMQKFVKMTGWETGMVDLITKEEGEFKVVMTFFIFQIIECKSMIILYVHQSNASAVAQW